MNLMNNNSKVENSVRMGIWIPLYLRLRRRLRKFIRNLCRDVRKSWMLFSFRLVWIVSRMSRIPREGGLVVPRMGRGFISSLLKITSSFVIPRMVWDNLGRQLIRLGTVNGRFLTRMERFMTEMARMEKYRVLVSYSILQRS